MLGGSGAERSEPTPQRPGELLEDTANAEHLLLAEILWIASSSVPVQAWLKLGQQLSNWSSWGGYMLHHPFIPPFTRVCAARISPPAAALNCSLRLAPSAQHLLSHSTTLGHAPQRPADRAQHTSARERSKREPPPHARAPPAAALQPTMMEDDEVGTHLGQGSSCCGQHARCQPSPARPAPPPNRSSTPSSSRWSASRARASRRVWPTAPVRRRRTEVRATPVLRGGQAYAVSKPRNTRCAVLLS